MSRTPGVLGAARTSLALLLAATAGLAVGAVSPAAADASYAVPSDGVLRLTGHGYGHGHGMSQYGARGAAQAGLTQAQIMSFYYPGTSAGTVRGNIWVRITADTDGVLTVAPASGLQVRQVGGPAYSLPAMVGSQRPTSWRLRTSGDRNVLEFYAGGAWRAHRPGSVPMTGAAAFFRDSGPTTLRLGSVERPYRGALRYVQRATVNVVGMDDFVRGVVAREMPASWEPAAVQSQAVAARTYAAFERAANTGRAWQTCDTTSCQVYGGVAAEHPAADAAVRATAREVRTYGGAPAFTQFSSSSGGWTKAGSRPYLVAKADRYDATSSNPNHTWRTTLRRSTVQASYPALGTLRAVRVTQRDGNGDQGGRVTSVVLDGSKTDVTLSGTTFRSRFGLKSDWFRFGG
ncbi:SpoIID/LytB domain-containing protein [Nocardioides aurantiacus]|uniref:SpoIID/LytB domain-containing protein n=1 Tax=Nocardioides aurantiacus TaxID=86796 RepID=UPI00403F8D3E